METLTESHMHKKKGRRVVLFPVPLQGHINPMLHLANILFSQGFSITILHTNFNSPDPSNHTYFTFCSLPEVLSESEATAFEEDAIAILTALNDRCAAPFRDLLDDLLSKEPIACLIADAIWNFIGSVCDSFKLPWMAMSTSNISSFLFCDAYPFLRDQGYLPVKDSVSNKVVQEVSFLQLEHVPDFPPLNLKDIPKIETRNPEDFFNLIANMFNNPKNSSGMIWNSFEALEKSALLKCNEIFHVPHFVTGPFHKYFQTSSTSSFIAQDKNSLSWLDTQAPKSVLYVSFGSMGMINKAELLEIAWGLANSKQPFLWVIRPGSVVGSEWLEPLPNEFHDVVRERGHIVKWAPQLEVLAHRAIGGFWTHCGWNSTLESISEGVPLICWPFFGDQKINAMYISDVWKIGLHLQHKLERGIIEKAIRRLMVDIEGKEIRDKMIVLKESVNICLKLEGSSNQSLQSLVNHILSF